MNNHSKQARELVAPMVDLFGGADGGVAFAIFQHQFLTHLHEKTEDGTISDVEIDTLIMINQFSKLCSAFLAGKL